MFILTFNYTKSVIYRKPNSVFENVLQFYNDAFCTLSHGHVVLAFNFNKDLLKLNNVPVIISDACKFVDINASFGLQSFITIPTRITGYSDNIFTYVTNCKCTSGTISTDITEKIT